MDTLQLQKFLNAKYAAGLVDDGIFGSNTAKAKAAAEYKISTLLREKYKIGYYSGFLAFRMSETFNNLATDWLLFIKNNIITGCVPCSTRAGDYYVFNPITYGGITGTAILAEGYYPKTWLGMWQTRLGWRSFECVQVANVNIYRDGNRNRIIDKTTLVVGGREIGVNIHSAWWGHVINRWSAGCIVVPREYWDTFANENLQEGIYYDTVLVAA